MPELASYFSFGIVSVSASIGALAAIVANVVFSNFMQNKRVIKEQKVQVLRDLMATRFTSSLDQKAAESINFIPVLFADRAFVLKAYEDYYDSQALPSVGHKFNALVSEIAKDVGITFKPLDLLRMPIFSKDHAMKMEDCNKLFLERNLSMKTDSTK